MNEAEIKEEILGELGEPTIRVELDPAVWDGTRGIFSAAKRWFQARKGCLGFGYVSAQREITLPDTAEVPLDVLFPGDGSSGLGCLSTLGFFNDIVPADVLTGGLRVSNTLMTQADYVQVLTQLEMSQRIYGGDREWMWDEARRLVLLAGQEPTGLCIIIWKVTKASWAISQLRDRDEDFIYRRCMIEAKRRLGRIRSKYSSYPAAGGSVETDGAVLLDEAKEEEEKLNEEIEGSQMPMPILTG